MNDKVERFTLHNDRGQSVLEAELVKLSLSQDPSKRVYGPFIRYSWQVNGQQFESSGAGSLCLLPDASGFILIEDDWKPDNAVLLDAYGKDRMRLTVPRELIPWMDDSSIRSAGFLWIGPSKEDGQCTLIGTADDILAGFGDFGCDFDYVNGVFLKAYKVRI